jgi:hypothetical protein
MRVRRAGDAAVRPRSTRTRTPDRRTLAVGLVLGLAGLAMAVGGAAELAGLALALRAQAPLVRAWTGAPGLLGLGVSLAGAGLLIVVAEASPASAERGSRPLVAAVLVVAVLGLAALARAGPVQGAVLRALGHAPCAHATGVRTAETVRAAPGRPCPAR